MTILLMPRRADSAVDSAEVVLLALVGTLTGELIDVARLLIHDVVDS